MNKDWYKVSVDFRDENLTYACQFEKSLEESVFSKKEDEFIKLLNVRWTGEDRKKKINVIKLEDYNKDIDSWGNSMYVKRDRIAAVYEVRKDSIFFKNE